MRQRIAPSALLPGMYLCGIDGSWLNFPFWRTRMLLTTPDQVRQVQAAGLRAVWIDTRRGLAPARPNPDDEPAPRSNPRLPERTPASLPPTADPALDTRADLPQAASRPPPPPAPPAGPPCSVAEETAHAKVLSRECMHTVRRLFEHHRETAPAQCDQALAAVEQVWSSVRRNPAALISLCRIKEQGEERYMHAVAVCGLMVGLAQSLQLDAETTRHAGLAGLLHDVGRTTLPDAIAADDAARTTAEQALFESYPEAGAALLRQDPLVPEAVITATAQHRERLDGFGFPAGLSGDQIHPLARMLALCDDYDSLTSDGAGRAGLTPAAAIQRLALAADRHYDGRLLQHFVRTVGIYPVGSLVRLRSNTLAVVCEPASRSLLQPVVKVFFSLTSQGRVPPRRIDLAATDDAIVGRENPKAWGFEGLNDLWMV